jgi:ubiquinol-cytochrome c reductase cytochrome b subunit
VSDDRPLPLVEVWQEGDGAWRWRYLGAEEEDGAPLVLPANEPESSQDDAVSAARVAYPDVPLQVRPRDEAAEPGTDQEARHRRWRLLAGLVLAAVVAVRLLRREHTGPVLLTALGVVVYQAVRAVRHPAEPG